MALVLVQYLALSSLQQFTERARGAYQARYGPHPQGVCYAACISATFRDDSITLGRWNPQRLLLIRTTRKSFIVYPACSPWKCFGSCKLGHMGITTHGESVQPLQSVKLVYQPCSWTRATWILTEQLVAWMVRVIIKIADISNYSYSGA